MRKATGKNAKMWGGSMVGYDRYDYTNRTTGGTWFRVGFSPRKQSLTLYIMDGFEKYDELMKKLGKHKTGKSCLYIKRLSDVDIDVLEEIIEESVKYFAEKYGDGKSIKN
jgi:hypothetical protein